MLRFAVTGITQNHAADIEAGPTVTEREARLPPPLLKALPVGGAEKAPLPEQVGAWLRKELSVSAAGREAEWSDDGIYFALPRTDGQGWLSFDPPACAWGIAANARRSVARVIRWAQSRKHRMAVCLVY